MNRLLCLLLLWVAVFGLAAALPLGYNNAVTYSPFLIPAKYNPPNPSDPDWGKDLFGGQDASKDSSTEDGSHDNVSEMALTEILMVVALVALVCWLLRPLRCLLVLCRRPQTRLILTVAAPEMEPLRIPLWKTIGCARAMNLSVGEEVCQTHVAYSWFFCMSSLVLPYGWATVVNNVGGEPTLIKMVKRLDPVTAFRVSRRLRQAGHVLTFQWEHGDMLYRVVPNALPYNPRDPNSTRPPVDSLQSAGPIIWQAPYEPRFGGHVAVVYS